MNAKINWIHTLEKYLPQNVIMALRGVDKTIGAGAEEIRMRAEKPLMIYTSGCGHIVKKNGAALIVSTDEIAGTFDAITGRSPYAFADEIGQGFLTLENGIRAGLAGSAVLTSGPVKTYKAISGINFRIPAQATGIARKLLPYITCAGMLKNTLILSAPKLGKTTLVRDIARCAGSGDGMARCKVTLIDERQELASSEFGRPRFDVGIETDIISGVVKHNAVFMALRALSPDVIVTDEIGMSEDLGAMREVANAGVTMITTAHAPDLDSLMGRLFFKRIFEERLIQAYVALSAELGRITVASIHDGYGQDVQNIPFLLERPEAV